MTLADRIEALDGPDIAVDRELFAEFHGFSAMADMAGSDAHYPPYTASLDAAMTLVPDGWSFSLGEMMGLPLERRWRCHLRDHNEPYNPSTCKWVDRDCQTPALAICAAALRAKETPHE